MRPFASGHILAKICKLLWENDRLLVDYFFSEKSSNFTSSTNFNAAS